MTASFFRAALAVTDRAIDTAYAEAITVTPMLKGDVNARAKRDPARPVMVIQAIFDEPSTQVFPDAKGHASASSHQVATSKPTLDFATAALPYTVVIGDLVTRANGTRYEVSDPGDDGLDRTVLKLTART